MNCNERLIDLSDVSDDDVYHVLKGRFCEEKKHQDALWLIRKLLEDKFGIWVPIGTDYETDVDSNQLADDISRYLNGDTNES